MKKFYNRKEELKVLENLPKGTIIRTTRINDQQREIISILNVAPIGL